MINNTFISNLFETCKNDQLIREDGKNLTLFNRIADFFHRKQNYDHFKSACQKLSEACTNGSISVISPEEQIEILGRFRQIQKKLTNSNTSNECDQYIRKFESTILNAETVKGFSQLIFKEITEASISLNRKKINHDIRELDAIIEYSSNDKVLIDQIVTTWRSFTENKKSTHAESSNLFDQTNHTVIKKLLYKEEAILQSNDHDNLDENYPFLLRLYLETEFKNLNKNEVYHRILILKSLMDKHSDNKKFIVNCLQQIDQFLGNAIFQPSMQLSISELKKTDLLMFRDLFPIIDQHLPSLDDKKLILDLKIKCANLPCPVVRSTYPCIFLSEKDQLDILIEGFQKKENETINTLSEFFAIGNPSVNDVSLLAELVSIKSGLSHENLLKLRTVLESRLKDETPKDWEDFRDVEARLESLFLLEPGQSDLILLKQICTSKTFFVNQLGLDENMILIPRWYHATNAVSAILISGEIQVRHEKAFRGAWISSSREPAFGSYVLSLSNKVTQLDPKAFIGYQYSDRRWRGIQKAIPLKMDQEVPHLTLVGIPTQLTKLAEKTDRLKLVKTLKEKGFPNPVVLSVDQVDFMQKEVMNILGTPNLPDQWWGTGRAYSEHQLKLNGKIQSIPLDSNLFKLDTDAANQLAIAKVIQTTALPFYKAPMPQEPSYCSDVTSVRVELSARTDGDFQQFVEKVNKKETTARAHHGAMHCVRVALWTQLLSRVYEKLGRERVGHPILLATAGAYHDISREDEGIDYWDGESSQALQTLLSRTEISDNQANVYVTAIKEKDPKKGQFSSDVQRIVHDADCLDIIRVIGKWNFSNKELCFYHFDKNQKPFCDQLIKEIADFINVTEKLQIRNHLEHYSEDFYGDLVRLLFAMKKNDQTRFPLITQMLQNDMLEILKTPETEVSKHLLSMC